MQVVDRKLLEEKRDELIIDLIEQGYTTWELRVIFNKHPDDIEKILIKNGYGKIIDKNKESKDTNNVPKGKIVHTLKCPNKHDISYVLVCGGENNKQDENIYFRMSLNGEYTDVLANGELGVTEDMKEHADGGCCNEPICPVCSVECII